MSDFNRTAIDAAMTWLDAQLAVVDPLLDKPYGQAITWQNDVDLVAGLSLSARSIVTQQIRYGASGTQQIQGKAWLNPNATEIVRINVEGSQTAVPMHLWGMEVAYNLVDLEVWQKLGVNIDQTQFEAMNEKWQNDVNDMAYIGDAIVGTTGLTNDPAVDTFANTAGAFSSLTPDAMLQVINDATMQAYTNTGGRYVPTSLLVPPAVFALMAKRIPDTNETVLSFLVRNSLATSMSGVALTIKPNRYLVDKAVMYNKAPVNVKFPVVPLQAFRSYDKGLHVIRPYVGAVGQLIVRRPETVLYINPV